MKRIAETVGRNVWNSIQPSTWNPIYSLIGNSVKSAWVSNRTFMGARISVCDYATKFSAITNMYVEFEQLTSNKSVDLSESLLQNKYSYGNGQRHSAEEGAPEAL